MSVCLKLLALGQAEMLGLAFDLAPLSFAWESRLADAALVHLAERENIDTIFTLDRRDFSIYRTASNRVLHNRPVMNWLCSADRATLRVLSHFVSLHRLRIEDPVAGVAQAGDDVFFGV